MEKLKNIEITHHLAKTIESARQAAEEDYRDTLNSDEIMAIAEFTGIRQTAAIYRGARLDPHAHIFKQMFESTISSDAFYSAIEKLNNLDK